ncbi:MAG: hypothetical protein MJZ13_07790 [Bacteroidales bacterium]|nr:hypothetical protein [Bacteroidales bacterium]
MRKLISAFEYLYYRIYATYKYRWHENMPGMYALGIVSLMQLFMLFLLLRVFPYLIWGVDLLSFMDGMNKFVFGSTTLLPMYVINYWYFYKHTSFEILEEKWVCEPENQKKRRGRFVLCFIVLFFLVTVALAGYVGETRNS